MKSLRAFIRDWRKEFYGEGEPILPPSSEAAHMYEDWLVEVQEGNLQSFDTRGVQQSALRESIRQYNTRHKIRFSPSWEKCSVCEGRGTGCSNTNCVEGRVRTLAGRVFDDMPPAGPNFDESMEAIRRLTVTHTPDWIKVEELLYTTAEKFPDRKVDVPYEFYKLKEAAGLVS